MRTGNARRRLMAANENANKSTEEYLLVAKLMMEKQLKKAEKAGLTPAVPEYITDVANYGPGARPDITDATITAYRALRWTVKKNLANQTAGHHLYDLLRSGMAKDALAELKTKLFVHQTEELSAYSCDYPKGWPLVQKCLWVNSTDKDAINWLTKNIHEVDKAVIISKLKAVLGEGERSYNSIPRSDLPYAAATLISNMVRLEAIVKKTKSGNLSVGALLLVELAKELLKISELMQDQDWIQVKRLRTTMMVAAHTVIDSLKDHPGYRNRQDQVVVLFNKKIESLEEHAQFGKLVAEELSWNRSKTSDMYSRAATVYNKLFINAWGPEKMRLSNESGTPAAIINELIDSYCYGGSTAHGILSKFMRLDLSDLVDGKEEETEPGKRSTTSLIRELNRGKYGVKFILKNFNLSELPDAHTAALLRRVPDLYSELPAERIQKLAESFPSIYNEVFRKHYVSLPTEVWERWCQRNGKNGSEELLEDVTRITRDSQVQRFQFSIKILFDLKKSWEEDDISLWFMNRAPGLPTGIFVHSWLPNFKSAKQRVEISYCGNDMAKAGFVSDIEAWLRNRNMSTPSAGYTFNYIREDLAQSKWDSAVKFLRTYSAFLGRYFKVDKEKFEYGCTSYQELLLMTDKARAEEGKKVLFNFAVHADTGMISSGTGITWDSRESALVALQFIDTVVSREEKPLGYFVLPSTFLYRVGLTNTLLSSVREGKGSPSEAHRSDSIDDNYLMAIMSDSSTSRKRLSEDVLMVSSGTDDDGGM